MLYQTPSLMNCLESRLRMTASDARKRQLFFLHFLDKVLFVTSTNVAFEDRSGMAA
jgi:hypothetical protein